tara:strand:+ start:4912 stop:5484 length:573 start_codon:yes stop_codon:yes gene_type:complete
MASNQKTEKKSNKKSSEKESTNELSNDNSIYFPQILNITLHVKSNELNKDIDSTLHKILKDKVEGMCVKEGMIIRDSTKIISKSAGKLNITTFNGNITYNVQYKASVCNPKRGQILPCFVRENNRSAVICYMDDKEHSPVNIYLHKEHHIGNVDFVNLIPEDKIMVEVVDSAFEYLETQILVLCKFIRKA